MDQETNNLAHPAPAPDAPDAAERPAIVERPQARLSGVPVIIWALIVIVIVIAILAWFDLVGGDML